MEYSKESVAYAQIATKMIHIGALIRAELRSQGQTNAWLAERLCITPRHLQKLFNKPSIDTQQLVVISRALKVDFFKLYSSGLFDASN